MHGIDASNKTAVVYIGLNSEYLLDLIKQIEGREPAKKARKHSTISTENEVEKEEGVGVSRPLYIIIKRGPPHRILRIVIPLLFLGGLRRASPAGRRGKSPLWTRVPRN